MSHLRNIKEMLSIPTGSRNVATSGYSSVTDSQLFFGSQFWPENSQGTSQDMSLSSRNSQQSSQEGSDPKFSSSYHTKPLLFGELKDKKRAFGILDKFEEDRNKAKEKNDNNVLAKECQHTRETLKDLVAGTEKNTNVCQTVLEKFDTFAATMKDNLNCLESNISKQFENLLNKVNSQREMMTELQERLKKGGDTTAELGSSFQSLKHSLESLREEQERERNMFEEALKLLRTLTAEHLDKPRTERVMESAIQTSPGLEESLSNILQDNKLENTQLALASHNLEHTDVEVPPPHLSCFIRKNRGHRRRKKRPLVLSQKRRCVSDENSQPIMTCNNKQNISDPLCERRDLNMPASQDSLSPDCLITLNREMRSSEAAGCLITPLSCWSQDSNTSTCLAGIKPILERLSDEPVTGTPVKHDNFWHLFGMDCDSVLGF
ncbi:hypothetical protein Q5P01_001599 [Channa striata]|uniref:Interactor of HORMAD1 protein 1 n=1 Tax=Channa striata TaxID=64152 RepID=A0AA88T2Z0_CHASR|nr:hypothetical protein Q5P01_001599 [Channa striata]